MTSNISHTLLGAGGGGGAGVLPASLAQEIAGGNFHDNRESLHDYIYSKLILGEENNHGASAEGANNVNVTHGHPHGHHHHSMANSVPVFPTSLVPTYASSIAPQGPIGVSAVDFTLHPNNNTANDLGGVGVNNSSAAVSARTNAIQSSSTTPEPCMDLANATIPSTPQVSTLKPGGSSKKKSHHKNAVQHHHHHLSSGVGMTQINVPNHEGLVNVAGTKPKKNKSPKQKKEKVNFCDVCGRGFAERYTLNRHMMTHTHVKPYSCTKCNMAFSRSDGLAKHMKAGHRRIDAHHCDVCGGTFNSELSFEQHKREYGSTLPFVCNLCMLAFSQCCHLNYHMKSHALKSDYGVEVTAETSGDPVDVDALVPEDFTSPPKSKDSQNKISLAVLNSLNPDIRIKHEIDDGFTPYSGDSKPSSDPFNHSSTDMSAISNAIAVATGVSSGETNHLGSATTGSASSGKSAISEMDMKKYYDIKIPNPNPRFGDSSSTGTAGAANSDGTPSQQPVTLFRCHICGKGFTRKYHMQRHVRLHTRGPVPRAHLLDWTRRPYACGVCKMGFTRQHHLTRHMLIHTGERPHSCHICGKAFRRYTNLSLHVRTVHGSERPFKCPICGRGFPRVYSLHRHLNTHGKNNDAQLLMNAGLLPFPKKDENADSKSNENETRYMSIGTAKMSNSSGIQPRDALLSDGSDMDSSSTNHHQSHPQGRSLDPARQSEMDRISASIDDTIGQVIKGAMAQGNKKPRTKKSSSASSPSSQGQPHLHPHQQHPLHHQQSSTSNPSQSGNNANPTMQSEQMMNLSSLQQQDVLQQHQHQLHHHQQQQHHHQQQHSRHQDNSQQDRFATSSSSSSSHSTSLSNAISRQQQHDLAVAQQHQRSTGNFNDLTSMRASTPSSYSQQQQHNQQQDRSTTPFALNPLPPPTQQQQQLQSDGRPSSAYAIHNQSATDRSSTPFSQQQQQHHHHQPQQQAPSSNLADRSSTPFLLNQQPSGNLDSFQIVNTNNQSASSAVVATTSSSSSRPANQQQQQQQLQQLVAQLDGRSDTVRGNDPIIFAHPAAANGFQFPMGATMDLSTNQRSRLVVGGSSTNPATNTAAIRQGPADFGHNLTLGQTALNLNAEAAAFAHVQATNNLSSLFPTNATLTYHQQQLMGEALSRLDMELQAAHQGTGQLPATSLSNNVSSNNRPY